MAVSGFSLFRPPHLNCSRPYLASNRATPSATSCSSTSSTLPKALIEIQKSGLIACLRAKDADMAMKAACAALSGGISVLEIVMSTPGVLEVIKTLCKEYPSLTFGVGTVLNAEDARKAVKAGAQFLMSPGTVMEILCDHESSEVLYIPGVMTPTEVLFAYNAGAQIVKVYPVSLLGGQKYISALKRPFAHIPMVASQGIATGSVGGYIEAGASAVVLSDAIFEKDAMRQRNFGEIERLAYLATLQTCQARKR
ncbi:uncharacterized protein [Typha latifolia]|uniref:uncharacterized protein n=1 Tax=Typha latifolia TaxID=4733 RepID=UPI003C2F399C